MQTDLSLNGHNLNDSIYYLYGYLDMVNLEKNMFFTLNSYDDLLLPDKSEILDVTVLYRRRIGPFIPISLKMLSLKMQVSIQKQRLENRKQKLI